MVLAVSATSGSTSVALTVLLAVVYLLVLRFLDLNEKEPIWAMGLLFSLGLMAGFVLYVVVPSTVLELNLVGGAVLIEIVKIAAIALGFAALATVARWRGMSDVNGPLDGVVYGAAVGLGVATGAAFVRDLLVNNGVTDVLSGSAGPVGELWPLALTGLAEGVFGGIAGAAFGFAAVSAAHRRVPLYAAGAAGAVLAHVAYAWLARGGSLGAGGQVRALVALVLPVVAVLAVIAWSLAVERRAIRTHAAEEVPTGAIAADEVPLLSGFLARRAAYLRRLGRGDLDGWGDLKALHNRQIQLVLTKARAAGAADAADRARHAEEAARLRAEIAAIRAENPSLSISAARVGA